MARDRAIDDADLRLEPRWVTSVDLLRRCLPWEDDSTYVFDLGNRKRRVGSFGMSVYFVLGFALFTFGLLWLVKLFSPKVAFYFGAALVALVAIAVLKSYVKLIFGRRSDLAPMTRSFAVLWAAGCIAFMLVAPGPVRSGLIVEGATGFWAWLWFFVLQTVDIMFTGIPRGLGADAIALTPVTWPARICLGAFNVAVAFSLVELLLAIWRLHFSSTTVRETVRGMHDLAAQLIVMDDEADEDGKGVEVVCRARLVELSPTESVDAISWEPGAEPDDETVYRWTAHPRRGLLGRVLFVSGLAVVLPVLAFGGSWLLTGFAPKAALLTAFLATVVTTGWRIVSMRRTLVGSPLERMAATNLAIHGPTLLSLGFLVFLFTAPGPVRDGLVLPAGATALDYAHLLLFSVASAVLLDLPDGLGLFVPRIELGSSTAAIVISVFKLIVALGIVEGVVAAWRAAVGKHTAYATDAAMARGMKRLPRIVRAHLRLSRTHVEKPLREPFVFESGLLEHAWDSTLAREKGSLSLKAQAVLGVIVLVVAGAALWYWAPDLRFGQQEEAPEMSAPAEGSSTTQ